MPWNVFVTGAALTGGTRAGRLPEAPDHRGLGSVGQHARGRPAAAPAAWPVHHDVLRGPAASAQPQVRPRPLPFPPALVTCRETIRFMARLGHTENGVEGMASFVREQTRRKPRCRPLGPIYLHPASRESHASRFGGKRLRTAFAP